MPTDDFSGVVAVKLIVVQGAQNLHLMRQKIEMFMNFVLQVHAGMPTFAVVDKSSQVIEQLDGELFAFVLLVAGDIVLYTDFQRVGQDGPCDATVRVR